MAWVNTKFATIDYTNWRGERALREIKPIRVEWGSNEWHPEPQWLLVAFDHNSKSERTFAMANIRSFRHCMGLNADEEWNPPDMKRPPPSTGCGGR